MKNKVIMMAFLMMAVGSRLGAMQIVGQRNGSSVPSEKSAMQGLNLDYPEVAKKTNFEIAQQCLAMLNIDRAHKLLCAILVYNARLACSQKCELIQVVRAREFYKPDAFLDAMERLLMRGAPSHALHPEELRQELARTNFAGQ